MKNKFLSRVLLPVGFLPLLTGCLFGGKDSSNNKASSSNSGAQKIVSPCTALPNNPLASPTAGGTDVKVSWAANREGAVNAAGGGYLVYYGTTSNFDLTKAPYVPVPFDSSVGSTTQTKTTLPGLAAGTYYIKVVACSPIVGGSGNPSQSQASAAMSISVP